MGEIYVNKSIVSQGQDDPELPAKEKEYLNYIDEHVNNVQIAFNNLFVNKVFDIDALLNDNTSDIDDLELHKQEMFGGTNTILPNWNSVMDIASNHVKVHDASKYSDEEFYGYRRHFNPTEMEKSITDDNIIANADAEYEKAWIHHYKNNSHHPKYWVNYLGDTGIPDKNAPAEVMGLPDIIEMICDWEAMHMKFHSDTVEWYNGDKSKDERHDLNPYSKVVVENLLRQIYNKEIVG